ncbi:MAG: hypothetical protein GX610_23920 [Rhodococcus sp.]|nr:hypothetical protein [Rhodococcus sp. (in: high G+C Gram-positive bacteria)]
MSTRGRIVTVLELDREALTRCIDACDTLAGDMEALLVRARTELAPDNMGFGEGHLPSAAALTEKIRVNATAAIATLDANRTRALDMRAEFAKALAAYDEQESMTAGSVAAVSADIS